MLDRYTKRGENGKALCNCDTCNGDCYKCELTDKQMERLAAYEDSGLSPEQVQEIAKAQTDGRLAVLPAKWRSDYYFGKKVIITHKAAEKALEAE